MEWNEAVTDNGYDDNREIESTREFPLRTGFVRTTLDDDRFDEFIIGVADIVAPE